MHRTLFAAAVAVLALSASSSSALVMVANFSTTQKTVQADAVVLGKVSEIEKEEVEVLPFPGATDKVKMRVGVIKIESGLVGAKNVTHVKVLIPGTAAEQPAGPQPIGRPGIGRPIRPGMTPITLKEGEEGLYFLAKHPFAANYYSITMGNTPVLNKAENFKDEVAKVKAVVATLAEPMKALKAEKAEDRLAAAATLIQKYRRGLPDAKEVAIPAEETKAILKALADADWTAADKVKPGQVFDYQTQPANVLSLIGLFPGSPNGLPRVQVKANESYNAKFHEAFKEWLAKSGDTFEIKKFVPKD